MNQERIQNYQAPSRHSLEQAQFTWATYGDATLAGLTELLPIPLLDSLLERHFRRRIPTAIASVHGYRLAPDIAEILGQQEQQSIVTSAVRYILKIPYKLLIRFSRKIFYIWSIHRATELLSYYWRRAFLINYMLEAGHLADRATAERARRAMDAAIDNTSSPLGSLARHVVGNVGSVLRVARHALRGRNEAVWSESRDIVTREWESYATFFERLAASYEQCFQQQASSARR